MARPRAAQPVKLVIGLLSGDQDLLRRARHLLSREYGDVDTESDVWPFTMTDYYEPEMGPGLRRWFLSFQRLIRPEALAEIKRHTNELEQTIAADCLRPDCPRPVNIDPGYLDLARLILATTKDRAHRIYVGLGIYAEVTLQFAQGAWQPASWTYPDYRQTTYHAFFDGVRERYRSQLKQLEAWNDAPPKEGA
ncbi:MAG: DUF4416 family protein [Phycisphaerae bacterium]|jgi:hypothetical protein